MTRITDFRRAAESFVVAFCVVLATTAVIVSAREVPADHAELRHRVAELEREQEALETWAVQELRPWVIKETTRITKTLPTQVPKPSVSPLPPPPVSSSTLPRPTPLITSIPSPSPSSTSTCIPIVHICLGEK